jgi:hypothetical protein
MKRSDSLVVHKTMAVGSHITQSCDMASNAVTKREKTPCTLIYSAATDNHPSSAHTLPFALKSHVFSSANMMDDARLCNLHIICRHRLSLSFQCPDMTLCKNESRLVGRIVRQMEKPADPMRSSYNDGFMVVAPKTCRMSMVPDCGRVKIKPDDSPIWIFGVV